MKISATQYARALYELTVGQTEAETAMIVKKFALTLRVNRALDKSREIIESFEAITRQEAGEIKVVVESARPLDESAQALIREYINTRTDAKKILLESEIKPELLGGFILRYNGKIIDGSLAGNLRRLDAILHN
jgi:F-type H+-transporting ATPase subunit delta